LRLMSAPKYMLVKFIRTHHIPLRDTGTYQKKPPKPSWANTVRSEIWPAVTKMAIIFW
jgi:hypothetical protein